jgi:hypothetical protein
MCGYDRLLAPMARRSHREQKLRDEQDTVAMRRAERKEQEELTGRKRSEVALTKAQRLLELRKREHGEPAIPRRVARPGKPLKR